MAIVPFLVGRGPEVLMAMRDGRLAVMLRGLAKMRLPEGFFCKSSETVKKKNKKKRVWNFLGPSGSKQRQTLDEIYSTAVFAKTGDRRFRRRVSRPVSA